MNLEKEQIGIGVPGINRNNVYTLQIPLPPLEAQEKIVEVIENIESKIQSANLQMQGLEVQKRAILTAHLEATHAK